MSRYLVTGATGFLGSHLVTALVEIGHDVVAFSRGEPDEVPWRDSAHVTVVSGDICDAKAVGDASARCDGMFHCAGVVSRKPEDAELCYRVHVEGTKIALDAARAAGVRRVVVASTSGVVAVSREPDVVKDETAPDPLSIISAWPYYRSKLFGERAALERNGPGFSVLAVNPTLLLGPGDLRGSSTEDIARFLEGRLPAIPAGGISFVDARDAASAMILAMDAGTPGERYLVAAQNLTMAELCARLERISGVKAPRLKLPGGVFLAGAGAELVRRAAERIGARAPVDRVTAEMAQHYWYVDSTKARRDLGWEPRDPADTLSDTIDDLRARGVVWPAA